ncbi:helix-turn-helix domain-containing protein [Bailinhaonella thermotolerans]|uniref:helix-turn-helix domain-containing protein n=1 Tax=Bailinhaonella thermotolerans TaxID=1070861 RepID=UPI00192A3AA5|nr:helix-turn-helix domain-containing protein [Bailinhaonella thermotolerans]
MRIDTREVKADERLEYWLDRVERARFPLEAHVDAEGDFHGELRVLALGTVHIGEMESTSIRVNRSERLIRRRDPEEYQLTLVRSGWVDTRQCGRYGRAGPGEMLLRDSSRPFTVRRTAADGLCRTITVQFPRSALSVPAGTLDSLLGVPLSARRASGALLARQLIGLMRHGAECVSTERAVAAQVLLDLVAAACGRELTRETAFPRGSGPAVLLARIHDFIERGLADPGLCPRTVAEAHQISLRTLHALFQERGGPTVAAWIRHRRLERCRRDLADPALAGRTIEAIAARWGFPDRAHFTKLFRATYDVTPGEYRTAVLTRPSSRETPQTSHA